MAHHIRNSFIAFALGTAVYVGLKNYDPHPEDNHSEPDQVNYSTLMKDYVNANKVHSIEINRETSIIKGKTNQGALFESKLLPNQTASVAEDVLGHGGDVKVVDNPEPSFVSKTGSFIASNAIPLLLLAAFIGYWRWTMKNMAGGSGPGAFGKSKAILLTEDQTKTTFADVAGADEAKEEVKEFADYLADPAKYQKLGGKIPRGALMIGPPGTGKTLLARAIAGEAKVPFFTISGSDFVEMFVGVGASRVRDMFEQAKKNAPCIIFIDEIDAVGRQRGGASNMGGNDERENTLNALLVEMDGFTGNEGIIVIAATNRADVLDKALLRPGRFDRQVTVGLPDVRGREQILNVHMRKVPAEGDINLKVLAQGTPGFSGADLANIVNEAALLAARENKHGVTMVHLEKAKDKIMMGAEMKSRSNAMSEEEKKQTAYHEAGHCIVGRLLPVHDPVYKVSIMPRGRALGITMFLPERDQFSASKEKLESQIATLYGGRIAEEIIFKREKVATGASNDIERATQLATHMVARWGLVNEGEIQRDKNWKKAPVLKVPAEDVHPMSAQANELRGEDKQTRQDVLDQQYNNAYDLLETNIDILHAMAEALMTYETIDKPQIDALMERRPCPPPVGWEDDQKLLAEQQAASNDNAQEKPIVVIEKPAEKKGWRSFKPW